MADIDVLEGDGAIIVVATVAGQNTFDFDFLAYTGSTVKVTLWPSTLVEVVLELGVDYSVSGLAQEAGGSITLIGDYAGVTAVDDEVLIYRETPIQRLFDYQNAGDFRAETVNRELDTMIMIDQELKRESGRAYQRPLGEGPGGVINPGPDGTVPVWLAGSLAVGPSASEIAAAQGYSLAALAAQVAAEEAAAFALTAAFRSYGSKAEAETLLIPAATKSVLLIGYYAASPGIGMGMWRRASAAPAAEVALAYFRSVDRFMPDGSISPANGGWWVLMADEGGFVWPEQLGCPAAGNPAVSDHAYIQAAVHHSSGHVKFRPSQIAGGRYYYNDAEIVCPYPHAIIKTEGAYAHTWIFAIGNGGKTFTFGTEAGGAGAVMVEGIRFERSNFENWYLPGNGIAAIQNQAAGSIVAFANDIVTGQMFFVTGSGTQADRRKFKAGVVVGNLIPLLDPVTSLPVDTTAWTPWVAGGNVHPYSTVGASDLTIGVDHQTVPSQSWHIRIYGGTFYQINRCAFTGHGRQLWVDTNSYGMVDHCVFSGYWDDARSGWQDTESNIYLGAIFELARDINGVNQANPGRVTVTGNPYVNGDRVYIYGLNGMPGLNDRYFIVNNVAGNSFDLLDFPGMFPIDTTAQPAYISGGKIRLRNPGPAGLTTLPKISNCVFQSTGLQSSAPGFTNKSLPVLTTVGNASLTQRNDIGAAYAINVLSAEGLDVGPNNYMGGQNRDSIRIRPQAFSAPSGTLIGHIKIFSNFLDGSKFSSIHQESGDGAIYALHITDNTCNGGDVCDHVFVMDAATIAAFNGSHLSIKGNTSQGHRKSPYVLRDVKVGLFSDNTIGGYNVLGATNVDGVDIWSGVFSGGTVKGVLFNGNVYGGGVGDPDGANNCKWGSFISSEAGNKRGVEHAFNLGLAGGGVSTMAGAL